jgi:hypothetical protein
VTYASSSALASMTGRMGERIHDLPSVRPSPIDVNHGWRKYVPENVIPHMSPLGWEHIIITGSRL